VCLLHFEVDWDAAGAALARRFGPVSLRDAPDPCGAVSRLAAYFSGDLRAIDGIPVDTGGTAFQMSVWSALREIPVGRTACYSDLAARIGKPSATRAVGAANGQNPVAVIVPCHRVIGKDGSLTGYGGGLERKAWLLRHEGVLF
jgi:methylated-DNA-[protein]-cysteine S-methyltransferase